MVVGAAVARRKIILKDWLIRSEGVDVDKTDGADEATWKLLGNALRRTSRVVKKMARTKPCNEASPCSITSRREDALGRGRGPTGGFSFSFAATKVQFARTRVSSRERPVLSE
jgi:hypothetical protein